MAGRIFPAANRIGPLVWPAFWTAAWIVAWRMIAEAFDWL